LPINNTDTAVILSEWCALNPVKYMNYCLKSQTYIHFSIDALANYTMCTNVQSPVNDSHFLEFSILCSVRSLNLVIESDVCNGPL